MGRPRTSTSNGEKQGGITSMAMFDILYGFIVLQVLFIYIYVYCDIIDIILYILFFWWLWSQYITIIVSAYHYSLHCICCFWVLLLGSLSLTYLLWDWACVHKNILNKLVEIRKCLVVLPSCNLLPSYGSHDHLVQFIKHIATRHEREPIAKLDHGPCQTFSVYFWGDQGGTWGRGLGKAEKDLGPH